MSDQSLHRPFSYFKGGIRKKEPEDDGMSFARLTRIIKGEEEFDNLVKKIRNVRLIHDAERTDGVLPNGKKLEDLGITYREAKDSLPWFIVQGVVQRRRKPSLNERWKDVGFEASNLLCLDVDAKDNHAAPLFEDTFILPGDTSLRADKERVELMMESIRETAPPWVKGAALSPSGIGIKLFCHVPLLDPDDAGGMSWVFSRMGEILLNRCGVYRDDKVNNCWPCFFTHDPNFWVRKESTPFEVPEDEVKKARETWRKNRDDIPEQGLEDYKAVREALARWLEGGCIHPRSKKDFRHDDGLLHHGVHEKIVWGVCHAVGNDKAIDLLGEVSFANYCSGSFKLRKIVNDYCGQSDTFNPITWDTLRKLYGVDAWPAGMDEVGDDDLGDHPDSKAAKDEKWGFQDDYEHPEEGEPDPEPESTGGGEGDDNEDGFKKLRKRLLAQVYADERDVFYRKVGGRFLPFSKAAFTDFLRYELEISENADRARLRGEISCRNRIDVCVKIPFQPSGLIELGEERLLNTYKPAFFKRDPGGPIRWGEGFEWIAMMFDQTYAGGPMARKEMTKEFMLSLMHACYRGAVDGKPVRLPGVHIAGDSGLGKSLTFTEIFGKWVMGKCVDATTYMSGEDQGSTKEVGESPVLILEDLTRRKGNTAAAREIIADNIKKFVSMSRMRFRAMRKDGFDITTVGRIIAVLSNTSPSDLQKTPPVHESMRDKMVRVHARGYKKDDIPFREDGVPMTFPDDEAHLEEILLRELGAFCRYLYHYTIPPEIRGSRFCVRAFCADIFTEAEQEVNFSLSDLYDVLWGLVTSGEDGDLETWLESPDPTMNVIAKGVGFYRGSYSDNRLYLLATTRAVTKYLELASANKTKGVGDRLRYALNDAISLGDIVKRPRRGESAVRLRVHPTPDSEGVGSRIRAQIAIDVLDLRKAVLSDLDDDDEDDEEISWE